MSKDDIHYVRELALGSHAAFKVLFMKYFPVVKYFIANLIKSETVAEELAQDVFVKIWEQRIRLHVIKSFNSYICKMAKNMSLNYLEHKYIEALYLEKYQGETSFSIEEDYFAKELELFVELAVKNMPTKRKTIYEMSRKNGLSNDEIALKLGISKKTVENHLNIALNEIRKLISTLMTILY